MMQALRRIFQPHPSASFAKHGGEDPKDNLSTNDAAWSEDSALYGPGDFEKYNPDDLIGRKGFGIYRKMMMDEQVKAVVKFKRDAITSRDYFFELDFDKHGISEEEASRRIEINNAILNQMKGSFLDVLNNIMSSMYNGFSMNEKVFKLIDYDSTTWWGLQAIKIKPFDTFYFKPDDYGNIIRLVQRISGRDQTLNLGKFIHFLHNPDVDEHYGQSELREAYRAWFSKDKIIKFRNIWLERHAGGFRWMQPKAGESITPGSPVYVQMQDVLRRTQTGTSAIFPSSVEFNVSYPTNQVGFKEAIQDNDLAIARALLVPNLLGITPAGQTGSFAQSDTQLDAFFWTIDADTGRLEDALNEQLFDELNQINFGDDAVPRFRFKPLSEKKKMELVGTWKELIDAGAVKHSESDEKHLRELLSFPEIIDEEQGSAVATPSSSALTGAQVESMVSVVIKVGAGELSKESAKNILVTAFPISWETADVILADVPEKPVPVTNPFPSQNGPQPTEDDLDDDNPLLEDGDTGAQDETIIGKGLVNIKAFQRALKRVDFSVISSTSDGVIDDGVDQMGLVMGQILDDAILRIKKDALGVNENDAAAIMKFKLNPKLVSKLRKVTKTFLREGWRLGTKHSKIEVDKAKKDEFGVDHERIQFIEARYFDLKSFGITGKLNDDSLAIIKNLLLNGAKTGKTTGETIQLIYEAFASAGLMSLADAKVALGAALGVTHPDHRLQTIVKTNTFEAINEARYAYFTDPSLGGFVEALEYSAILDLRTTQICRHLDGQIHSADSEVWKTYRPPNHFNCRSLLIPVTQMDTWAEDDDPLMNPQQGFE